MQPPPIPDNEQARLEALRSLGVLDTDTEEAAFDAIARTAAMMFGVPLAGISLVDESREWFKASVGAGGACEGDRDTAFCAHTILTDDLLVVEDALLDERFRDNPKVTRQGVRFYAGAPITLSSGERVGALCIRDTSPRAFGHDQREMLRQMARAVAGMLEYRRDSIRRSNAELSESQLRLLLDEGAIISVTDPDGTITHVNDMFCSISGYSRDELIGANHRIVKSGVHPEAFWRNMYRTIKRGRTWKGVIQNRRKNGEPYWVQSVIRAIHDQEGRMRQILAIRFDITDLRQAVRRLRDAQRSAVQHAQGLERAEALLNRVGEMSRTGGWELDLASSNLTWTRETYHIHEIEPGSPVDVESAIEYYAPEARPRIREAVDRCIGEGTPFDMELPFVTAKGRKLTVRAIGQPVTHNGRVVRLVGAFQDITEQKASMMELERAREAAEVASRAKSGFLANMSHELRTPLTSIIGFSELLGEDTGDPEAVRNAAGIITTNARHLLTLINDILDLSKIESDRIKLEPVECAPSKFAEDLDSMMRCVAESKGIAYETKIEYPIAERVQLDEVRVRQILVNLVGNAVKFTSEGRVRLRLSCRPDENARLTLIAQVEDTGIGMDEACMKRIFRPFTQAEPSSTRRFGGTGLGLSISKRLAEMMGGRIEVSSEPGVGSRFTLIVPVEGEDIRLIDKGEGRASSAPAPKASERARLDGARVLLVEDGVDNQKLLNLLLTKAGATVEIASNGREGVDAALAAMRSGDPFDLVLMDMQMPVLDGYGAARELREAGFQTPIVALTAFAMAEDRAKCLAAGCDDFLTKPISRDDFIACCARWGVDKPGGGARAA